MRVVSEDAYAEVRDALAQDWGRFLATALPRSSWLPIPNLRHRVVDYVATWQLDGLILTGGGDHGRVREQTEIALLEWALAENRPVLGVCQGLQRIQSYFGGELTRCPAENHVGRRHPVRFAPYEGMLEFAPAEHEVNSFHRWGIRIERLAAPLIPFATTTDGWVEGARTRTGRLAGIMWHPERERPVRRRDLAFLRRFFHVA